MSFLSVPLKKTYEVNLTDPLKTFISNQYKSEDNNPFSEPGDEINEAITEFNKLRNKAVVQPLDKHESSLEVLYSFKDYRSVGLHFRYYDQLCAVEAKLPLTPTQIPVNFKWKDAFDKGSLFFGKASLTSGLGSFERACVMFNIGALQSQIAAAQPLSTDEEMKTAAKLYQQAAGTFSELKDSVMGLVQHDQPTTDLLPDTLAALTALMLAQAQDAIYLKASKDKMKPALLVKVAAQTAQFYQEAGRQLNKDFLKPLWEKDWISIVTGKHLAFQSLAQFHQASVCNQNKEIGEELCRLQESVSMMSRARAYFGNVVFNNEAAAIQKAHDLAKKDNDFIYHERIPDIKSLSALPTATLAKCLPPTPPLSQRFKDMFSSLVPVAVTQALASYDVRKQELVNMEVGRMREHTQLMNTCLTSLNLPAAIDDVCNQEPLPESLREKSSRVKAAGGVTEIEKLMGDLPGLLKRNQELLDETVRVLTEEKTTDEQLRTQFKEKWGRVPSEKLTQPLWADIGKYKGILETAQKADGIVRQKMQANQAGIEMLSKPEPELRNSIPGLSAGGANAESAAVKKLQTLMIEVEQIKGERELLEKQLKDSNEDMTADFLKALAQSGAIDEESLSRDKLNLIYAPVREQISESVKRQEKLLEQIQQANSAFTTEKSAAGGKGAERENTLRQLATAADAFMELRANLQEGQKFYNDLTPLLVRLQQKVTDFVFARKTEKDDLMQDIQKNIVNAPASGKSAAPPPRPPPPAVSSSNQPAASAPAAAPPPANPTSANPYPPAGAPAPAPYPQQAYAPYPAGGYAPAPYGYPQPYPPQPYPTGTYPGAVPQGYQSPYNQQPPPQGYPGYNPYMGQQPPQWPQQPPQQ